MTGIAASWRRKLMIDEWLRRACKATKRSYRLPSYVCEIDTRLPNRLRILAQRSAVMRFPECEPGGAGVTIAILILPQSSVRRPFPCVKVHVMLCPEHPAQLKEIAS